MATKKVTTPKAITNYLKLVNKSDEQVQKEEVTRNHRKLVRAAESQIRLAESKIEDKQDDIVDVQEEIADIELELARAKVDLSTDNYSNFVREINVVSTKLNSLKMREARYESEIAELKSLKKFNEEILTGLK